MNTQARKPRSVSQKVQKTTEQKGAQGGVRKGVSFRGQSFGGWGEVPTSISTYYSLYRKNTDIKSAVRKLSNTTGRGGFFFSKMGEKFEDKKLERAFKYLPVHKTTIIRDLWIGGNAYVAPVKNLLGELIDLQILDPRTVYVIANKHGEVIGYVQRSSKGELIPFEKNEIYHLIDTRDHDNEVIGMSRVETLIYDVMGDDEAQKSNYAFFKNNAIPNTLIILEDNLKDEDLESAVQQLKQQFAGGSNRHKISANKGIKDIKQLSNSIKDMEFLALRKFTIDKVSSAMDVPKVILGYHEDVNYSNSDNMYKTFIEETVRPLEVLLSKFFSDIIKDEFGLEDVLLEFVDNRNFDRKEKIEEAEKLIGISLMTINEGRTFLGKDTYPDDWADKPIIKQGFEFSEDIGTNELLTDNQAPKAKKALKIKVSRS